MKSNESREKVILREIPLSFHRLTFTDSTFDSTTFGPPSSQLEKNNDMIPRNNYKKLPKTVNYLALTRMQRRYKILGAIFVLGNIGFIYFIYTTELNLINFSCNDTKKIKRKYINPPHPSQIEDEILSFYKSSTKELLADRISNIIQDQIRSIQAPSNCTGPNFICGHYDDTCGFGCQLHHRVACLMMSYAMKLPLIHDEVEGWPFSSKWSDVLLPLGTKCTPGPKTFRWGWRGTVLYRGQPCLFQKETSDQIEYPLRDGIPVSRRLANLVETIHPNPFIWWVGQFMKYALRLRQRVGDRIEKDKQLIGFQHPTLGVYLSTPTKFSAAKYSNHELDEYGTVAGSIFENFTEEDGGVKRVFVASEDFRILTNAQKKFSHWKVIEFPPIDNAWDDELFEMLRIVYTLSECDFLVCGYGSDICRLMVPVMNSKHLDGMSRIRPLDSKYKYFIHKHTMDSHSILKIDPFDEPDPIN